MQQTVGRFLLIEADYFWKHTHNAYDFDVLLNTTITFPIAWHNSKLDGVVARPAAGDDQAFQSTANLRYQRKTAEWVALTWRYNSGLAVSPRITCCIGKIREESQRRSKSRTSQTR